MRTPREIPTPRRASDRDVAVAAIHGNLDILGALGKGQMSVRGLIPLADALDRVLDRLGLLLKEGQ